MTYINKDNLFDYAFLNTDTLKLPLKGICVCFHGYTDDTMFEESNQTAKILGEKGIAWVFPYYSVWGWLGKNSIEFCEQVIDAVYDKLNAPEDIPFITSGGSMGGLASLMYCILGKRKVARCAADCPVTDILSIFNDVPNIRRAVLSAHIEKDGELAEILKSFSPVYRAKDLPGIPYYLNFGSEDKLITEKHYPAIVEKLKENGHNFSYHLQEGMGHCEMDNFPEALEKYCAFIIGE